MFRFTTLALTLALTAATGCASKPQVTSPIPTENLTAISSGVNEADSYEEAMKQAKKFCSRWGAAPSMVKKDVKYTGKMSEGTNAALNKAAQLTFLPIGNGASYETTLTYKCY